MNSRFSQATSAYRAVDLQTQTVSHDQYQLVVMMFESTLEAIARAKGALHEQDVVTKVAQINRAMRIIQEGLRTSLDLENGGELAANLANLYDYCVMRLTQANASNSIVMLDEVANLIKPVAEAWKELRGGASNSAESTQAQAAKLEAAEPTTPKAPPIARRVGNMYSHGMAAAGA